MTRSKKERETDRDGKRDAEKNGRHVERERER
jgi:hypothetical protein